MQRLSTAALSALLLVGLLLVACGDKKKPAAEEDESSEIECEDNSDCEQGYVCLDGACAAASGSAVYTDPKNAVTPDKVRSHMESINKKAEERAAEAMGEL